MRHWLLMTQLKIEQCPRIDWKTKKKKEQIGNKQNFFNTLWIYLQFCKALSSYKTRYVPSLSRSKCAQSLTGFLKVCCSATASHHHNTAHAFNSVVTRHVSSIFIGSPEKGYHIINALLNMFKERPERIKIALDVKFAFSDFKISIPTIRICR